MLPPYNNAKPVSESTITLRHPYRLERLRARLAMGIGLSILVHACILSLQFGIPGLALPGLELPWNKRRAQTPELTVRLADATPSAPPPEALPAAPLPEPPLEPKPRPKPAAEGLTLLSPMQPPEPAKPIAAPARPKAPAAKKAGKPKPPPPALAKQAGTAPARLITRTDRGDDDFVVPLPGPQEPSKPLATGADQAASVASVAQAAEPQPADTSASQAAENLSLQKQLAEAEAGRLLEAQRQAAIAAAQQLEEQKQEEQKQAQRAQEMSALAAQQREADAKQLAAENAARELAARESDIAKAEELARRQAAALVLQQQQAEAEKLREQLKLQQAREELARTQQLETQRQEEQKRQELARQQALQLAQQEQALKELEAQKRLQRQLQKQLQERAEEQAREQALEQAREQAHEQALAQARQKQQEELAARQKADALARQQAETPAAGNAAQQRERDLAAQAGAAAGAGNADGKPAPGFVLPKSLLGSDLASRALDQARKLDLLRGNPPVRRPEQEDRGRRRSLLGSIKEDVPLRMYVDSWRQKIERNGSLNYSQIAKGKARGDPVVTVAIRSDGSVEDIIINRSSGRADIDEAVRRIVRVNARYSAFPPNIAEKYDVIEIRRIWNFEETLKILEEVL